MLKPRPQPSTDWLCAGSPRKKRSNTRGSFSGEMPAPVLAILNSARFPSRRKLIVTRPCGWLYLTALSAKLSSNCRKRWRSPRNGNFLARFQRHFDAVRLGEDLRDRQNCRGPIRRNATAPISRRPGRRQLWRAASGRPRCARAGAIHPTGWRRAAFGWSERFIAQGGFNFAAQNGQRRFQFVRGVQGEFADAIKGIVQPRESWH